MILKKALGIPVAFNSKSSTSANDKIAKIEYAWMDSNVNAELSKLYLEYNSLQEQYLNKFEEAASYAKSAAEKEASGEDGSEDDARSTVAATEAENLYQKLEAKQVEIDNYIRTKIILTTTTNPVLDLNIGSEKVNYKYLYVKVVTNEAHEYSAIKVADVSSFDWDTYLAELEASKNVTEETVKNPETVVAISVIGLAIIAIAGTLVAKKKNLFSRV